MNEAEEIIIHDGNIIKHIGPKHAPLIVAEMSGNHNQSLERALRIIEVAAECGADAIKFQTYTADTITIDCDNEEFIVGNNAKLWEGKSLYKLYEEAHTPWEWHEQMFAKAREVGILPFSSPFDETAVDFLEKLDCPMYKVASFELVHIPLIKKIATTNKPIIMSTGMADRVDLSDAVYAARAYGPRDIALLACTSTYPATPENSNIRKIVEFMRHYGAHAGLSDHTLGNSVALGAVGLGATVIEKHFTLSRAEGGVDAAFSMEPAELKELVRKSKNVWTSLGNFTFWRKDEAEQANKVFRRSIYIVQDMEEGDIFTKENIRVIRPSLGMRPKFYERILGEKVNKKIKKGTPLTKDLIADCQECEFY